MFSSASIMQLSTALCAILSLAPIQQVSAVPAAVARTEQSVARAASSFWLANVKHQGTVWGASDSSYEVFRDVTDARFAGGADPTGARDSSTAIQAALDFGNRCGWGCNSSTIQPAIVYFPPGTYSIGNPIVMNYYTQMIGDAAQRPTITAASNFTGMALFDSDPYHYPGGISYWINQNNFFRQVRNFVFDFTPDSAPDGAVAIHWQVAQATSIQNVDFLMKPNSNQQGIFMDNGSGGFFSDLFFKGGSVGAFLGSQQFTSRNLRFEDCETAIMMNWNWGWTLHNVSISGGQTGIYMASSPANQTVGSVILADSQITGTQNGIVTAYNGNSGQNTPASGGTLVLDNVDMSGVTGSAVFQNGTSGSNSLLSPGKIDSWIQGSIYDHTTVQDTKVGYTAKVTKNQGLLNNNGMIFTRSKPQYEGLTADNFVSAKSSGCKGDGVTDDTQAVQDFLNSAAQAGKVAFFDHGAYLLTDTVTVPNKLNIVGEVWPLIVADGKSFNDANNPKAVFQVGTSNGGSGAAVEISDLIFETNGPAAGAIMVEWNLDSEQGDSGMWDSHVRIGGTYGTNLQTEQCRGSPGFPATPDMDACGGVFLMFHATESSNNVYLENDWFWVADHDLDDQNQTQISIYSGRGALFNSKGPVWLWGTASEHSIIYNYQLDGVSAFFGGFMQSETPYFQPNPIVPSPLNFSEPLNDPRFSICPNETTAAAVPCQNAWGMRIHDSTGVLIYAAGMYSFFNDYTQQCVQDKNCQENMIRIQGSQVDMYTVTTIATVNMIRDDRQGDTPVLASENRDVYGDTLAFYSTG